MKRILKVGRSYLNRMGRPVRILRERSQRRSCEAYSHIDSEGQVYTSSGKRWRDGRYSPQDIVATK